MRRIRLLVITLTLVASLVGCAAPSASADEVRSEKPRESDPAVAPDDLSTLVEGNNAFAWDLYHEAARGTDNAFFSPYSISIALAMTYAGARADTETQIAEAMHFELPQDRLHPVFNSLDQVLSSRGEGAEGKDDEGFRLNVVNAVWGQRDFPFLTEYLDLLARNYGAGLRVVDFQSAPEESRVIINEWVEQQTENRIQDLIPEGAINEITRLVLTNAVYFNAAWASQFEEDLTRPGEFHLLDGSVVEVPMMSQSESFRYTAGDGYAAVELPYSGHELSMVLIVPESGEFESFEQELNASIVESILDELHTTQVTLSMPGFKLETNLNLNEALANLGMTDAFDPARADLSGMDGARDLYITDVVHKAFVDVDEAGTEAAAATAVIVGLTSAPAEPVSLTVDRPFIFLIRDVATDTTLFLGRVMDPS